VLSEHRGLSLAELAAVADLERRVIEHDGGRLKLEWASLRSRSGEHVDDLLWRSGDDAVGFLGLYAFGPDLELAGMVDPAKRRTGIGSAMLTAALRIAPERGYDRALLVTPRSTDAGRSFAAAHGGELDHSEHFLVLGDTPAPPTSDPGVTLRPAVDSDAPEVMRILATSFGHEPTGFSLTTDDETERTWVIEQDARTVGTLRLTRDGSIGSVYGFGVDPARQGQGIGRAALVQACRWLRDGGATRVTLEVEVDNDNALGLYLSVGFERWATDDYFAVPTAG
jgi:ribosomal protein S18 acetylase RimI-like enzyme